MCTSGDRWQERLEAHFRGLAARRAEGGVVFALEHGLNPDEVDELHVLVASTQHSAAERRRHWLAWVVHATEVAYQYSGDEYWQSFERKTPGWSEGQYLRTEVRSVFQQFAREFRGPIPGGRWAEWFTIICWPITNAILPTDLQRHLARALYMAGTGLARRIDDITELGRYVAASGWEGSDRFNQLRDQPVLLGQIALALLRPQIRSDELVLDSTLHRIANDLMSERSSAGWLHSARGTLVAPSLHLSGRHIGAEPPQPQALEDRVERAARLAVPRVFLRGDGRKGNLGVFLRLPNLSPVADVAPAVREALRASTCWAPAADAPISRGRLLFDAQDVKLSRWPDAGTPLLRFQGLAAGLETALLRAWDGVGVPAVFQVQNDGTSRQLESRAVRAGRSYILALGTRSAALGGLQIETECSGVCLYRVVMPEAIDSKLDDRLRKLGMLPTRTSVIWPAGSVPSFWDGEGRVEWLTSDLAMLGIEPNHDLRELSIELTGAERAVTTDVHAGSHLFFSLPPLTAGTHDIRIREVPRLGVPAVRVLQAAIREPRYVTSNTGPVKMWVEPYSDHLDDLWGGASAVCLAGPSAKVELSLTLAQRPVGTSVAQVKVSATVPLTSNAWRDLFRQHVLGDDSFVRAYDDARWCKVDVDANRFGRYSVEFERPLPPLRWRLTENAAGYQLLLQDDTEGAMPPSIQFASFDRPTEFQSIAQSTLVGSSPADPRGGLCLASRGADVASVVVPQRRKVLRDLREFGCEVHLAPVAPRTGDTAALLRTIGAWSRARLPGETLARSWRAHAVRCMHCQLVGVACGAAWNEAENVHFRARNQASLVSLASLLLGTARAAQEHTKEIIDRSAEILSLPPRRRIEAFSGVVRGVVSSASPTWAPLIKRRGPNAGPWAIEFYLRLATDPNVDVWAGSSLEDGLNLALAWPLPTRIARYLALATVVGTDGPEAFPPLFQDWDWQ